MPSYCLYIKTRAKKDLPTSYRPISLADVVGKISERIIARQLQEFFACNGLLTDSQLEMCMGVGNAGFPFLPRDSHGNGN